MDAKSLLELTWGYDASKDNKSNTKETSTRTPNDNNKNDNVIISNVKETLTRIPNDNNKNLDKIKVKFVLRLDTKNKKFAKLRFYKIQDIIDFYLSNYNTEELKYKLGVTDNKPTKIEEFHPDLKNLYTSIFKTLRIDGLDDSFDFNNIEWGIRKYIYHFLFYYNPEIRDGITSEYSSARELFGNTLNLFGLNDLKQEKKERLLMESQLYEYGDYNMDKTVWYFNNDYISNSNSFSQFIDILQHFYYNKEEIKTPYLGLDYFNPLRTFDLDNVRGVFSYLENQDLLHTDLKNHLFFMYRVLYDKLIKTPKQDKTDKIIKPFLFLFDEVFLVDDIIIEMETPTDNLVINKKNLDIYKINSFNSNYLLPLTGFCNMLPTNEIVKYPNIFYKIIRKGLLEEYNTSSSWDNYTDYNKTTDVKRDFLLEHILNETKWSTVPQSIHYIMNLGEDDDLNPWHSSEPSRYEQARMVIYNKFMSNYTVRRFDQYISFLIKIK